MPLSFLIPGWAQAIFGPGSAHWALLLHLPGRRFAAGFMVGSTRRLGNRWWAVGALWAIALNPALIKMYSQAVSQVLAAAMIVWILALALGAERKAWQLWAGAALAGVLTLTRLNLSPVLLFLILYIWWQYGWRRALQAGLAGGVVVLIGHAVYWPNILRMWAFWAPDGFPLLQGIGRIPHWRRPQLDFSYFPTGALQCLLVGYPLQFRARDGGIDCMVVVAAPRPLG